MICSNCGGVVEWKGKLTELSHAECLQCGAKNCQVVDYDNPEQIDDLIVCGKAITKDGKRIDPRDIYQDRKQTVNCPNCKRLFDYVSLLFNADNFFDAFEAWRKTK